MPTGAADDHRQEEQRKQRKMHKSAKFPLQRTEEKDPREVPQKFLEESGILGLFRLVRNSCRAPKKKIYRC